MIGSFSVPDENLTKKYEELYRITCEGLNRLIDTSSTLDEKATKYLTSLGVILSILGFGVSSLFKPGESISGILDGFCFFLLILLFFILLIAAFIFMSVLSIKKLKMMPVSNELIEMFTKNENNYLDVLRAMAKGNVNAFDVNDRVLNEKIKKILLGEAIISFAIFLAGVFVFFLSVKIIVS
jgi:hypothetical protein